jgi:hypothetical protein
MRITTAGNVGIGTTSPGAALDVSGNATLVANFNYTSNGTYVRWQNNGTSFGDVGSAGSLVSGGATNDFAIHARSGNMVFSMGFTERMRITSGGNVGIGTTSTSAKLEVNGNVRASYYIAYSGGVYSEYIYDGMYSTGTDQYIYTAGAYNTRFYTNTSERMRITSGGNVGIGTTSPSYKLHVAGTSYFTSTMGIDGEGNGITVDTGYGNNGRVGLMKYGGLEGMLVAGNTTILRLGHRTDSDNVATAGAATIRVDMLIAANGNVGIGTTTAGARLEVNSSEGIPIIRARYNSGYYTDYDSNGIDFRGTAQTFDIKDNGSSAIRIASGGNVGIGTTSPGESLTIGQNTAGNSTAYSLAILRNGTSASPGSWSSTPAIRIEDVSGDGPSSFSSAQALLQINVGRVADADTYSNNALLINCVNDNGSAFTVTGKRRVGIVQNQPAYALDVTGDIRATGDVIAYSDARVKENVETITDALTKVTSLRGVSYTRNDSEDKSTKVGVIAQEVLEVLPEVVQQDTNGNYSVAYGNIVGVLIEAIKELKAEINELKNK